MKFNVKVNTVDDELMFRKLCLTIGSEKLNTPLKVSNKKNPVSDINEIYKEFSTNKLDNIIKDETYERNVNSQIKREKCPKLNFFITNYTDSALPNEKQLEALSDIQYEHSSVVITPIWSKITRELKEDELLQKFIKLTNDYIDIAETINDKAIIGIIPSRLPRQYLDEVVDNYYQKNVTSFIIDFDGRSIDTNPSWIRNLIRLFSDYGLLEESFLYSINANKGRFMKNAKEILAKDFMNLGFGIDILGLYHVRPRMPNSAWKTIKEQRMENMFRLFSSDNYSYNKYSLSELSNIVRSSGTDLKTQIEMRNMLEQHKETLILQQKIVESSTIEPYITSKNKVDMSLIKKIKSLKKSTVIPSSKSKKFFS